MRTSALAIVCVFMTLGLTMGLGYGSYGGNYGYSYLPYAPPVNSNPLGVGQGGILILFGVLFIFLLLLGNNGLNFTSSNNNNPTVTLIG